MGFEVLPAEIRQRSRCERPVVQAVEHEVWNLRSSGKIQTRNYAENLHKAGFGGLPQPRRAEQRSTGHLLAINSIGSQQIDPCLAPADQFPTPLQGWRAAWQHPRQPRR